MAAHPSNRCYELKGESLAAARALQAQVALAVEREKPQSSGNMGDIQASWAAFYERLIGHLRREQPELLRATGLLSPQVRVKPAYGADGFARAYETYPAIFLSPEASPRYFMFAPVGPEGQNFIPADAVLLTGKAEQRVGDLLFAGGWLGNAPLVERAEKGVAAPDASPVQSSFKAAAARSAADTQAFYIAAGRSLALVEDYARRQAEYRAREEEAMRALRQSIEKAFPALRRAYGADQRFSINMTSGERRLAQADTGLSFTVMTDQMSVPMPRTPAFHVVVPNPLRPHEYTVRTRNDTAAGRALGKILLAIPAQRPALADEPALKISGTAPSLVDINGYKVLSYFFQRKVNAKAAPAGGIFVPQAVARWLMDDDSDRRRGVTPPPMPVEIADYLVELRMRHDSRGLSPAKGPKKA